MEIVLAGATVRVDASVDQARLAARTRGARSSMIVVSPGVRVYLACGFTDMRKGMVGLAMLVQQMLTGGSVQWRSTPFADGAPG